jgi:hypothetical protein
MHSDLLPILCGFGVTLAILTVAAYAIGHVGDKKIVRVLLALATLTGAIASVLQVLYAGHGPG